MPPSRSRRVSLYLTKTFFLSSSEVDIAAINSLSVTPTPSPTSGPNRMLAIKHSQDQASMNVAIACRRVHTALKSLQTDKVDRLVIEEAMDALVGCLQELQSLKAAAEAVEMEWFVWSRQVCAISPRNLRDPVFCDFGELLADSLMWCPLQSVVFDARQYYVISASGSHPIIRTDVPLTLHQ